MRKPLLHHVFAQNALVPSDMIRADKDIFLVVPQGKTSYIRRFRPRYNDPQVTGQTERTVTCYEYDKLTDALPNETCDITVKIDSSDIKLVFDDLALAERYLNWLKTSHEESSRIKI